MGRTRDNKPFNFTASFLDRANFKYGMVVIVALILVFGFKIITISYAQTPYDQAISDYKNATQVYQQADSSFQLAKLQYLNSGTLASQQKAQEATYNFLKARDEVIATYLVMIKQKLDITDGISSGDKDTFDQRIDTEVLWYKSHEDKIPSAGSLNDLFVDSNIAKDQYKKTQALIYGTLVRLPDGTMKTFLDRITDIIGRVSGKTSEIRQNQDKDTTSIERSIIETQNRIDRARDKENAIVMDFPKIETTSSDRFSFYNSFLGNYDQTLQYLKEANIFLKEIVRNIKTQ